MTNDPRAREVEYPHAGSNAYIEGTESQRIGRLKFSHDFFLQHANLAGIVLRDFIPLRCEMRQDQLCFDMIGLHPMFECNPTGHVPPLYVIQFTKLQQGSNVRLRYCFTKVPDQEPVLMGDLTHPPRSKAQPSAPCHA